MIDVIALVRTWLGGESTVTSLLGGSNRIFGAILPAETDVEDHPAVVVSVRGGPTHPEMPVISPSVQLTVYAGADEAQHSKARKVYLAIFDVMQGVANKDFGATGYVLSCLEDTQGQDMTDPDTGWAMVVSFFTLQVRKSQ